jgi:hypothetical protein
MTKSNSGLNTQTLETVDKGCTTSLEAVHDLPAIEIVRLLFHHCSVFHSYLFSSIALDFLASTP